MEKDDQLQVLPNQPPMPAHVYRYAEEEQGLSFNVKDYFQILIKRKWFILGFLAASVTVAVLINLFSTPIYRATATLKAIKDNDASVVGARDPVMPFFRDEDRVIETQFNIMRSRSLAKRVIKAMNIQNHPEFAAKSEPGGNKASSEAYEIDLVDSFLGKLKTDPVRKTDLIRISFDSADQNLAQQVANTIAEEYTQFEIDIKNQSYNHIKKWLEQQLVKLGQKVEGSQRKLYNYGDAGEILGPDDKENIIVQKYVELSGLLTKASSERVAKEAQYKQIKQKGGESAPITGNPLVLDLRKQYAVQAAKVASMRSVYLRDHPKLQAEEANLQILKSRLDHEVQNIRHSVQSDYETARKTENLLTEAVESHKQKVAALQKKLVEYKIMKRDVETNEELYKGLLSRMKEASVASTMVASNLAVIDPAERPLTPFSPRKTKNMAFAILFGLMGGVCLALLVEHFDDSIKTTEEGERVCHLPSLGLIPQIKAQSNLPQLEGKSPGLLTHYSPQSVVADAIIGLRTAIMLSAAGSPPAVIMITSPNPQEGKTTMAVSLASSLATAGKKVVLIDADLRKPSVHKAFNMVPLPGLSDVLTGTASYDQVLQSTEIENLSVTTSGPIPPNPVALLESADFKAFVDYLRNEFQHVIIDSPPSLVIPDSRIISPCADSVIMVIKHNQTSRDSAKIALQGLTKVNANLVGFILNQVSMARGNYGAYYYSKSNYSYYN
jgi:polysaccharide biosynthesis transport protein